MDRRGLLKGWVGSLFTLPALNENNWKKWIEQETENKVLPPFRYPDEQSAMVSGTWLPEPEYPNDRNS